MNRSLVIVGAAILFAAAGCTHKTITQKGSSLSGTISASSGSVTDSDVNDKLAPYAANNSISRAQSVPNPVIIGGFVAMPGTVKVGRLANSTVGDIDDYYSVYLLKGQVVTLTIDDSGGANSSLGIGDKAGNDIDLYLLGSSGIQIAVATAANGNAAIKTLSAPATDSYYLRVKAVAGASNYAVNTGLAGLQSAAVSATSAQNIAVAGVGSVDDDFVPGEVIVKFKNTFLPAAVTGAAHTLASRAASLGLQPKAGAEGRSMLMKLGDSVQRQQAFSALGVNIARQYANPGRQLKYETLEVVKTLRKRPDVQNARLNYIRHATAIPDDTDYGLQWDDDLINLPKAWEVTKGSANVIVAVIDTGILENHPDLAGKIVSGYDFISDPANAGDGDGLDSNPHDEGHDEPNGASSFHGTHVAGTVAAVTNNSRGVAGVGWDVKVMPLRALGKSGGTEYDIEQAILYAAGLSNDSGQKPAQKADVINLSLGGPTTSTTPPDAFVQARKAGVIIVAAAGNDGLSSLSYPASLDGVVSVSAVDINKKLAYYSNYGSTIDVAAPGGDPNVDVNGDSYPDGVLSTWADDSSGTLVLGYGFLAGTSMAAPHVAGVAALMKSVKPDLTPDDFDVYLRNTDLTDDLGDPGRDDSFGYGLIDAFKAVQAASAGPPVLNPIAEVSPKTLTYQSTGNSSQVTLSNGGGGSLTITNPITNDSGGWLTVTEKNVDQATGLGAYDVSIDRNLLPADPTVGALVTVSYTATAVDTTVTNGSLTIPVMVYQRDFVANTGYQYVLLYDASVPNWWTQNAMRTIGIGLSHGKYSYRFDNVPPGLYVISAGADLNLNDTVCDVGEACGDYSVSGRLQQVTVTGSTRELTGLDFSVGYKLLIPNNQLNNAASQNQQGGEGKRSAGLRFLPDFINSNPVFVP